MKYLVIAIDRIFWHNIEEFGVALKHVRKLQGFAEMENGDTYQRISSTKDLRGRHGYKVLFWGPIPKWASDPETNEFIRYAEMP